MTNRYHEEAVTFTAAWVAAEMIDHAKDGGYAIPRTPDKECVEGYIKGLVADITKKVRAELRAHHQAIKIG